MSFDLAFWHEDQPIAAEEAVQVYWQLCESNDIVVKSHPNIALFLQEVSQLYPPIDDYPQEQREECPWSIRWSVTSGSAMFCLTWTVGPKLVSLLIQIAHKHDLVCYLDEVYLPPSLLAQLRAAQERHPPERETASKRPIEVWPSWEVVEAARERKRSDV